MRGRVYPALSGQSESKGRARVPAGSKARIWNGARARTGSDCSELLQAVAAEFDALNQVLQRDYCVP